MSDLITADLVRLDADLGADKDAVIRALAATVGDAGRAADVDQLVADAFERESKTGTGLPGGIAIPHCRTTGVDEPTLAFARLDPSVDFGAKDGAADLVFLIAAPAGGDNTHLQLLTKLARALVRKPFTDGLRAASTPQEVVDLVLEAVGEAPASAPAPVPAASETGGTTRHLVAVTACPTGIAHTYMAAEALEAAAARAGVDLQVETQGSAGAKPLAPETIAAADAVIFAVDVGVRDRGRFAGKPLVSSGVKRPFDEADQMIAEALAFAEDPNAPRVEGSGGGADASTTSGAGESWGGRTRRVLMTGVSYMIPFVAAGGLLIALSFLFGGYEIVNPAGDIVAHNTLWDLPSTADLPHALFDSGFFAYVGAVLFVLGSTAFKFLVPALAGYIAYAIADRPGIAPGFVMGALAVDLGGFGIAQSGFLGGIVGGVLGGLLALWVSSWGVPSWARGLMPVMLIPLVSTLIAGILMVVVLARPLGWLMGQLTDGLNSLNGGSAIFLGVILGLMMAFDMGGPLNKVAYAFATTGLATAGTASDSPELKVMAAVMLAGMVPPIALALATVVRPGLFNAPERENGKAGWLLGASFITEGAIPFAAADPLRVIPGIMLGSAVTGGLSMALDVAVRAPHGGIFVLFAVHNILGYFIALVAGVVVGAIAVIVLKSLGVKDPEPVTA
ncbi:PTS fructose transporter subunit IIABC [Nocardioides mangrovi]|uniref:Fructose-specific PTS transporter subunit EIIC n=1 Tax=Nocardioides mangrovi TaxID=2874580 RepID=A0ABS7UJV7_9ACTN|nr:fructose-specific PTS transporter subunit EIIC [Nocardioides mangrovi]MBZ5741062.1 fructose-specific PTS transporter subunit EIIC [Nocardioides mangrovi]